MDGNGRWAKAQRRPRVFGHQAGVKTVRRIVEDASEMGVTCMTLYSFSTENWTRPKAEIAALFKLLKSYVHDDLETLHGRGVRVRILGTREGLGSDLLEVIERVEQTTKNNTNFYLNIAFNYGGRDEILRAVTKAVKDGKFQSSPKPDVLDAYLDTAGLPEVDLVIRTSGEKRISNFLLWQAAYAEFVFTDVLWPDFDKTDLLAAIDMFKSRERRFGSVGQANIRAENATEEMVHSK